MTKKLLTSCLAVFCLLLNTYSQRFQVTTGSDVTEDKWAVVDDRSVGHVAIGNNTVDGLGSLWISSYNLNGNLITSAYATNRRSMIARDISIAPYEKAGEKPSYYVTGWTEENGNSRAFIGRIDLNGTFLWYYENPFTADLDPKEGVAVVTAPNGDVVMAGNTKTTNSPGGYQVFLARFTFGGALVWSNVYAQRGQWMVREIDLGVADPNCVVPTVDENFIITGEATETEAGSRPVTFAALYAGNGQECWRNLYPARVGNINVSGDAGYDVVFEPHLKNYCVVGVVETDGKARASGHSTPYILSIRPDGSLVASAVYLNDERPLGLYPRTVALSYFGKEIVFAGPNFNTNQVFWGTISNTAAPLPDAKIGDYTGQATANSYAQPFILTDAQPEHILLTKGTQIYGYLISTNAWPNGVFGNGDGHFIRTDLSGQTPDDCKYSSIDNKAYPADNEVRSYSDVWDDPYWERYGTRNDGYRADQRFCVDPPCEVQAGFTYTVNGLAVSFTNTSTGNGTLSYTWNFGDGTGSSLANPNHVYAAPGVYNVCLTVVNILPSGEACTSLTCQTITVINPCNLLVGFGQSINCKTVTYTNYTTGTGPITYSWLFDDGTTSTLANPVKTYTTCGIHNVRLIACNAACCDTVYAPTDIPCCTAAADFCLSNTGTSTLLSITPVAGTTYTVFVNGTSVAWPINTNRVLAAGANTVCVRARAVYCGDTCCATVCKTINVGDTCSLNGDFWFQVRSNGQVAFTNTSTPTGYTSLWEFGNGTSSTATNPTITYAAPGTYTVCLTVKRINGADTCEKRLCKTVVIDAACNVQSRFRATHCTATPLSVTFSNLSSGAASYQWNFGDPASGANNTSTATSPVHNFTAPGSYVVCLRALVNNNCWSRTCYLVIVSSTTANNSCTLLPGNPAYKLTDPIIKENEVVLTDQESGGTQKAGPVQTPVIINNKPLPASGLLLFPNPASQKVQAVFAAPAQGKAEIWIMNNEGAAVYKKVLPVQAGSNQLTIPVGGLPAGLYHVRIETGGKQHKDHFVVDNH